LEESGGSRPVIVQGSARSGRRMRFRLHSPEPGDQGSEIFAGVDSSSFLQSA